jgi:hypothetical protein
VAVAMAIPMMIMLEPAPASVPVAGEILPALIAGNNPTRTGVWHTSPIAWMPLPVMPVRIPIAFYPNEVRARRDRPNRHDAWRRRRANGDSHRNLSGASGDSQEECGYWNQ